MSATTTSTLTAAQVAEQMREQLAAGTLTVELRCAAPGDTCHIGVSESDGCVAAFRTQSAMAQDTEETWAYVGRIRVGEKLRVTGRIAAEHRVEDASFPAGELGELLAWLEEQTWSDFAQDLVRAWDRRGSLTERQIAAAKRMRAERAA